MTQDELRHFGILGQKWGRRRWQYDDGRFNEEGKIRYFGRSVSKTSKSDNKKIESYKKQGYGENASIQKVDNEKKTKLILGIIGGVALTSAAIYTYKRYGSKYLDRTIKAGKLNIQNIGINKSGKDTNNFFYGAINNRDRFLYNNIYRAEKFISSDESDIFKTNIKNLTDIKIASDKNARKIFNDLYNSDKEFSKSIGDILSYYKCNLSPGTKLYKYVNSNKANEYTLFNVLLANPDIQKTGMDKRFYEAMKNAGYDAISDINDKWYSDYGNLNVNPVIFLGDSSKYKIKSVKKIVDSNNKNQGALVGRALAAKMIGEATMPSLLATVGGISSYLLVKDREKINEYIDKHPNTELNNDEILRILKQMR